MNNINKAVDIAMCIGYSACDMCENIAFRHGKLGFPTPVAGDKCTNCGRCLSMRIYDPDRDDD